MAGGDELECPSPASVREGTVAVPASHSGKISRLECLGGGHGVSFVTLMVAWGGIYGTSCNA